MKRFHVYVSVTELAQSVCFYSTLFATESAVFKSGYAKWMLDGPRINFAISRRGAASGIDHLGQQVDTAEELTGLETQPRDADSAPSSETEPAAAACSAPKAAPPAPAMLCCGQ